MATILKHEINALNRQFYIDRVNEPLLKSLSAFDKCRDIFTLLIAAIDILITAKRYPDPHKYKLLDRNSLRLLEIWDAYASFEKLGRVKVIIDVAFRGIINKNEHSPNYRDRIGFIVEMLRAGDWNYRALNHPRTGWGEPKPYGGRP
ncbi:MAG: hypothetical protein KKH70_20255 [Gammaproteobacteria bacterium]|nr:hypothetical protein [Gammaproteobacteria bacterium]